MSIDHRRGLVDRRRDPEHIHEFVPEQSHCGKLRLFQSRLKSLSPLAENAPWPQVWVEIAVTDSARDYVTALEKIEDAVRGAEEPGVLIALQLNASARRGPVQDAHCPRLF